MKKGAGIVLKLIGSISEEEQFVEVLDWSQGDGLSSSKVVQKHLSRSDSAQHELLHLE